MAESHGNELVTRADLQADLHADIQIFMQTLEDRLIQALTRSKVEILEKTQGFIRDRQIALLRAFDRAAVFGAATGFVTLRNASIENPPWDKV